VPDDLHSPGRPHRAKPRPCGLGPSRARADPRRGHRGRPGGGAPDRGRSRPRGRAREGDRVRSEDARRGVRLPAYHAAVRPGVARGERARGPAADAPGRMARMSIDVVPIGRVESSLTDRGAAPKQGDEGAPDAWLVFEPAVVPGLDGIRPGDRIVVLTWLDRADRDVLRVHPRDDLTAPERGVFTTRSSDRPNPIGLHEVRGLRVDGPRV